jgi:PKD repeat protein
MKKVYVTILLFLSIICSNAQSTIEGYEYWFNDDFANKTTTSIASTQQLLINQTIPTSGLTQGINTLNFRSFDNLGKYSSIVSHFFYKTSIPETNASPEIVAYEYWLDNDYANAILTNTPIQQQINISELISMSPLNNGVHNFNIRFKDNAGLWSSVLSHFFYKTPEQIVTQNMITKYRYWFDNDFANAVNLPLTASQQINLMDNLDLTQLPKGIHEINFQFKDTLGRWSSVIIDTVEKVSLPIADFSYSSIQNCDSTIISFTDKSIDGDEYLWDFGDGTTSVLANPTHVYYGYNTYAVSLTVTDILLGKDSTIIIPIVINSLHTASTITATGCGSYVAPDGTTYTTSGIKTAIIPNAASCDSTITINLTINNVDVSITQNGLTLSANATSAIYQWLDCNNGNSILSGETNQSYTVTQNGSYAVEITQNGCIDTSACNSINNVGLSESTFNHEIMAYPNPTNGIVKIDLGKVIPEFTVTIYDINGKLISRTIHKNTKTFEVNLNVQSGIYALKINSNNKSTTIRLIKN